MTCPGREVGGHLAAGHAVNGVVDEDDGDILAAGGSVDRLGGADGGQVAVALVGEDDVIGAGALQAGSHSLGASMGGLHHIAGEVIVAHDRAAHRGHAHGLAFHTQLLQGLGHQAVDDAVGAAGTVVQGRVSEGRRFLKYNSHSRFPFQSFGAQSSNIFSLYSSASICSSTSAGVGIMPPVRP